MSTWVFRTLFTSKIRSFWKIKIKPTLSNNLTNWLKLLVQKKKLKFTENFYKAQSFLLVSNIILFLDQMSTLSPDMIMIAKMKNSMIALLNRTLIKATEWILTFQWEYPITGLKLFCWKIMKFKGLVTMTFLHTKIYSMLLRKLYKQIDIFTYIYYNNFIQSITIISI